jgi:hypothetical protein
MSENSAEIEYLRLREMLDRTVEHLAVRSDEVARFVNVLRTCARSEAFGAAAQAAAQIATASDEAYSLVRNFTAFAVRLERARNLVRRGGQ